MNIDELTLGQIKEIKSLKINDENTSNHIGFGEYVIVRTYSAGVFAGILGSRHGNKIVLKNCRRLWKWKSLKGISLSEVAQYGLCQNESKICCVEPWKVLEDIEISPCSSKSRESIEGAKTYEP